MAFMKPVVNTISADITNLSIYLRSTKKFGKTTLFRDVVLEKYGDPSCGLLVGWLQDARQLTSYTGEFLGGYS